MAHGAGGASKAEPNLTPMLDVVLNLLVFFILGFRLVTEQVDTSIKLPTSDQARPLEKGEDSVLFLNLTDKNRVNVLDGTNQRTLENKDTHENLIQTKLWLKDKYDQYSKDGQVKVAIVIRADKAVDYAKVYLLLKLCKEQGFTKLKVRAIG